MPATPSARNSDIRLREEESVQEKIPKLELRRVSNQHFTNVSPNKLQPNESLGLHRSSIAPNDLQPGQAQVVSGAHVSSENETPSGTQQSSNMQKRPAEAINASGDSKRRKTIPQIDEDSSIIEDINDDQTTQTIEKQKDSTVNSTPDKSTKFLRKKEIGKSTDLCKTFPQSETRLTSK